ncbi:tripartite tricarboxylate transporter substrate binding protein [Candidatus Pelagibacter giovannonii]|uniref:Tripartite tricarboxylate transporter substrate binding protein n=1 Tax=Candidatus Pelagibacter giovannonii TaxID=2563896 RepID=A0A6H1PZV4_9PROT|nr:tripartite tricarboxylate transporter substrate-binding protein [Candidatus Pelagibacter giovannonii]MDA7561950.1 tripartite tricarboxylate transporter substrate-binding protein [Candidatus Pelagibacter sp.]MDB9812174.1 tripartite tricarboxylate transporter substrate-binding protein [Candidatus Pelagibacter sp.]QIZ20187.1 tripartite tricarboxylate transporter substrate binding protein [Candidatus Pelagibacter giovannonii]
MTNIKKIVSVLFSAILLFSATATNSIAMDKIHFVIGGGAGGGWDGTARGTGEALTKSGMLKSASFENMSGGGGGKALAFMINTQPKNTILVQSTPLVLRSITRHEGYVTGSGVLSYKDVTPIAGVIGDYGAIAVAKNSPYKNFKDVVDAYKKNPSSIKMAGGSVRGSMDHLIGALAFQAAGANPNDVAYIPYDAGGKALAGLLSGETQIISTGLGELMGARDQVRIIGITAPSRVADAPDAPTLKEQGYDVQFVNWRGFFGPPNMSNKDKKALSKMLGKVMKTPEWEAVRKRNAWVNIYNSDKDFVKFLDAQTVEMTALMKKLGVI